MVTLVENNFLAFVVSFPSSEISIANKFANGEELDSHSFYGGKGTPAFELLKKEGFQTKKFELKNLRNRKKNILVKSKFMILSNFNIC